MPKKKNKNQFYKEKIEEHIGHIAAYNLPNEFGRILRVTIEETHFNGEQVIVYIENKPFPLKIYADQLKECSCKK